MLYLNGTATPSGGSVLPVPQEGSGMKNSDDIVFYLADALCQTLCRKTIRTIQQMDFAETLGQDNGLINTWDEICVQVQFQYSMVWNIYEHVVENTIEAYISDLKPYERAAIGLHTDEGMELTSNNRELLFADDELTDYIAHRYVYREAANWSNSRITAYLESCYG